MAEIIDFDGRRTMGDGGGPGDTTLEMRVARLEEDVKEAKNLLKDIQKDMATTREVMARIEGKLDSTPTPIQMWSMILSTWIAGAGIVALVGRMVMT